jgi:hypothetical protein
MKRIATVAAIAALAGLLSACTQLGPSIPSDQSARGAAAPAAQAGSGSASSPSAPVRQISAAAKATKVQLGIQIYWHEVNDPYAVKSNADRLFDYAVGLGANSVGISFPIYTDGDQPTRVYTKRDVTPTPASLQVVIGEAKARGLRVMLRPIIDENNIKNGKGAWRGSIRPVSMTAWFASYQRTLTPYLTAAEAAHADTFVLGSELDSLVKQSTGWRKVETAASSLFHGELSYADNWGRWATGSPGVSGADPGLDAYPQLHLSDSATTAQIATAWRKWLRSNPAHLTSTVVQEIGIAATPGAYQEPASWGSTSDRLDPRIQIKWFAGACDAIRALHMSGIYFWNVDAWADPTKAASYTSGSFMGRGDSAIKDCFASGWPGQ